MSGKLNKILTTGAVQLAGEVPMNLTYASLNILVSNPKDTEVTVELWLSDSAQPAVVDMIEPGAVVPAKGKLETFCRLVSPGEKIFVKTSVAGLVVRLETADEVLDI